MSRFGVDSNSRSFDPLAESGEIANEFDLDGAPANRSYNSFASTNQSGASSKAVLAALKALQDKIRRLEAERSQALDECAQLRHQMKNQEIEAEHSKQRENINAQKSLQEAKTAYDRLLNDKTELEVRVAKQEDKNREHQRQYDELHLAMRGLEEAKQNGIMRIKELENQHMQLDSQIQHAQQREKDLGNTMVWETKRHESEITVLNGRLQQMEGELKDVCQEKHTIGTKIFEMDQLVGQLLSVNESLVHQLSGKSITSTSRFAGMPVDGTKATTKKKKGVTTSSSAAHTAQATSRAVSQSTVATDASKTQTFNSRQPVQKIAVKTGEIEHLQNLHKMFVNIAGAISSDKKSKKAVRKGAAAEGERTSSMTGKARPKTRLGRKKAAALQSSAAADTPHTSSSLRVSVPTVAAAAASARYEEDDSHTQDDHYLDFEDEEEDRRSKNHNGHTTSGYEFSRSAGSGSGDRTALGHSPAVGHSTSTHSHSARKSSPSPSTTAVRHSDGRGRRQELQSVISSLEDEFESLNIQYRRLLSSVQHGQSESEQSDSQHANELVSVIEKLHKKGQQLRALKSPSKP